MNALLQIKSQNCLSQWCKFDGYAYWDPKEECIQNKSDKMFTLMILDFDALYWEAEATEPLAPKCKKIKVDEELVTDSQFYQNPQICSCPHTTFNHQATEHSNHYQGQPNHGIRNVHNNSID